MCFGLLRGSQNKPRSFVLGVGNVLLLRTPARKNVGKWCRGVLEADERFMIRWHEEEAEKKRQTHPSIVRGVRGKKSAGRCFISLQYFPTAELASPEDEDLENTLDVCAGCRWVNEERAHTSSAAE